ncbi:molybdopterin molybdotransferase MoeA [Slackia heliotrinireducens]|uniref:molybdopterin molybdotransferase MoeA n=1 Tax=Slackia heliotrinireducens TaxID=84110 RepID=UPI003315A91B
MLEVVSLDDARSAVADRFFPLRRGVRQVPLDAAAGCVLARDVVAQEGVPSFDRSTVDGYAVVAADTFGCSDALPALLTLVGEVDMGAKPDVACMPGTCVRIPTGGQVPDGADAVVMLEYCEEYGDGTVGVAKPVAPGGNIVFENDDVKPGEVLIAAGTTLQPHHVGTLASLGIINCEVYEQVNVGIISTGDEIVPADVVPVASQMRDVNAPVLASAAEACGARVIRFPIVPDRYDALLATVRAALESCDMVLVSGGSSAGQKDNTERVLSELGEMLFHGIAVKPGKPTMCADVDGVPVFGLPGHPVAAYFMFLELVRPLLAGDRKVLSVAAKLSAGVPSNHGRSELVPVRIEQRDGQVAAVPIRGKSGLISQLSRADGFFAIGRNLEGLAAGAEVDVRMFL